MDRRGGMENSLRQICRYVLVMLKDGPVRVSLKQLMKSNMIRLVTTRNATEKKWKKTMNISSTTLYAMWAKGQFRNSS